MVAVPPEAGSGGPCVGLVLAGSMIAVAGPILTLRGARQNDRARLPWAASELAPSGLDWPTIYWEHAWAVCPGSPRSLELGLSSALGMGPAALGLVHNIFLPHICIP